MRKRITRTTNHAPRVVRRTARQTSLWTLVLSLLNRDPKLDLARGVESITSAARGDATLAMANVLGRQVLYVDWKTTRDEFLETVASFVTSRGGTCDVRSLLDQQDEVMTMSAELLRQIATKTSKERLVTLDILGDSSIGPRGRLESVHITTRLSGGRHVCSNARGRPLGPAA